MEYSMELKKSLNSFEFNNQAENQQILVDMLLRYSNLNIKNLAFSLDVTEEFLQEIREGKSYLIGEQAQDLAQLFLIFLGRTFFSHFSIVRNYTQKTLCALNENR